MSIFDNSGLTIQKKITIQNYDEVQIIGASFTPLDCYDSMNGDIHVFATTGTAPFVFDWSNGSSDTSLYNLDAGTYTCLLYTSPSPRDATLSRMPSSA